MDLTDFVQGELLCLIPVLYAIGTAFKRSETIKDKHIPMYLGLIGIVLSLIYCVGISGFSMETVFTAIVQGVLVTSASVYGNQLYVQSQKGE